MKALLPLILSNCLIIPGFCPVVSMTTRPPPATTNADLVCSFTFMSLHMTTGNSLSTVYIIKTGISHTVGDCSHWHWRSLLKTNKQTKKTAEDAGNQQSVCHEPYLPMSVLHWEHKHLEVKANLFLVSKTGLLWQVIDFGGHIKWRPWDEVSNVFVLRLLMISQSLSPLFISPLSSH